MANRGFQRQTLEGPHKGELLLRGGFAPNAALAPVALYGNWIESVAHDSTGVWTVTIKEAFRDMDNFGKQATVQLASGAAAAIQFGAYDKAAGTLVVRNYTGGSLADIAADANNIIWLDLAMRYGNVPDGSPTYDS